MAEIGGVICGKYKVQELLGKGGMSCVYLVIDLKLQKKWAVKEIIRQDDILFVHSVTAEVNVMKKLDHLALPRIVDVVEDSNCIYVIMDYIEGENLGALLRKKEKIPQEKILKWAKELCGVLSYLHGQKPPIIYRDIKPANIMIAQNGGIKLIDFGSAREYKAQNGADTVSLGTRGYAAPEQLDGKGQTDVRTDIYSLGITLYHLLTGENPWEISGEFLLNRRRKSKLTNGWEYIIRKCIWRNPNLRYQNCHELLKDLNNYEKLDKKYQRKNRRKERFLEGTKILVIFFLVTILLSVIINDMEVVSVLSEEYLEMMKNAEKIDLFSAFKTMLYPLLQKVRKFLNL